MTDTHADAPASYSFDDLEAMYAEEESTSTTETPADERTTTQATEEPTDPLLEEELTKPQEVETPASKAFKAKDGERDVELNEELVIFKKVDGKEVPVKLKDALDNYAGQVAWDRKFTELDRERKSFQAEVGTHKQQISDALTKFNEVAEAAQRGEPQTAIKLLAELSGKDPVQFEKEYLENVSKVVRQYLSMSDEQRELYFAKQREEHYQKQLEKERQARQEVTSKVSMQQELTRVQQEFGFAPQDLQEAFQAIRDDNLITDRAIEVKDLVEFLQLRNMWRDIDTVLAETAPDADDTFAERLSQIWRADPSLTKEDIADIVKRAKGVSKADENLNRKVQKADASGQRIASSPQALSPARKQEVESWDDL